MKTLLNPLKIDYKYNFLVMTIVTELPLSAERMIRFARLTPICLNKEMISTFYFVNLNMRMNIWMFVHGEVILISAE